MKKIAKILMCLSVAGAASTQALAGGCPCDWNRSGTLNSQDYFDFLSSFFQGNADFNNDNRTNSQDYFDFLTCFFQGCPVDGPVIDSFSPLIAGPGDFVTVRGSGFGNNIANVCALVVGQDGQVAGFTRVVDISDNEIILALNAVLPGAQSGRIMLALGEGLFDLTPPQQQGFTVPEPMWVWQDVGGPTAAAERDIQLRDPGAVTAAYYYVTLDALGRLEIAFPSGVCPPGTTYRIQIDARTPESGTSYIVDMGGSIMTTMDLSSEACADYLCQVYDDALSDLGVEVTCSTSDDGTTTRFRVRRTGGLRFAPSSGYICIDRP